MMIGKRIDMLRFYDPYALGLQVTSITGFEAHCLCPYHNDSHPSAEFNIQKGVFHCFACGVSAGVNSLLNVTGGQLLMTEKPVAQRSDDVKDYEWVNYASLAFGNEYLKSRGVTDEQVHTHMIKHTSEGVAFPLSDGYATVGVQMRRYDNQPRYLTFGRKPPLWPMTVFEHLGRDDTLFIVEGIFGVLRAEQAGVKAVAVLGAGSIARSIPWLSNWIRKVVVFDNDDAGYIGAAKLSGAVRAEVVTPGREADELTIDEWKELADTKRFTRSRREILSHATNREKAERLVERFFKARIS